jgi:hypothetical protein
MEAADFMNKMLKRKIRQRLGYNGISEIKNHIWLRDVNWDDLYNKKIKPQFVPKPGDNFDQKSANKKEPEIENYENILQIVNKLKEYEDFYYDQDELITNMHFRKISERKLKLFNPHKGEEIVNNKSIFLHNSNIDNTKSKAININSLFIKNNDYNNEFADSSILNLNYKNDVSVFSRPALNASSNYLENWGNFYIKSKHV